MNRFNKNFKPLALLAGLVLAGTTSCGDKIFNKKPASAPIADTELQSSIDASFATFLVSDIDMIASFAAENDQEPDFYMQSPNSQTSIPGQGKTDVLRVPAQKYVIVTFNATDCFDGHRRDGSVWVKYENSEVHADYYRDYGFFGQVTLAEYKVDGWLIRTLPAGEPCKIYNRLEGANYDPAKTKLSWLIEGSFEFIHPSDPSKNMTWTGKLVKTLSNSTDPQVFDPSKQVMIHWARAIAQYTGEAKGTTSGNVPFSFKINERLPLIRDFSCSPDKVGGVEKPQMTIWNKESHPFVSGISELETGNAYPRQIYYGNEADPASAYSCDNSGVVLIKGIYYPVNFED